jgi:hypothetical protein
MITWRTVVASNGPKSVILIRLIVGAVFFFEGVQKFLFPNVDYKDPNFARSRMLAFQHQQTPLLRLLVDGPRSSRRFCDANLRDLSVDCRFRPLVY